MRVESLPYNVEVWVEADVNPSEDAEKVAKAVANLMRSVQVKPVTEPDGKIRASSHRLESIYTIYRGIRARLSMGVARRLLLQHRLGDTTWLFFNKQAAYAASVVICEDEDESPLGPIRVMIRCGRIREFIDWLAPST